MSKNVTIDDAKQISSWMNGFEQNLLNAIQRKGGNLDQHMKPLWATDEQGKPSEKIEEIADFCAGTHKSVPKDPVEIVYCLLRPHHERLDAINQIDDDVTLMSIGTDKGRGTDDIRALALSRVKDENLVFDLIEAMASDGPIYFVYCDQIKRLTNVERLTKLAIHSGSNAVESTAIDALISLKNDRALRKVATEQSYWTNAFKALGGISNIVEVMQVARDKTALEVVRKRAAEMEREVKRLAELKAERS